MKSEYYIGQVVKTYRKMIDEIEMKGHLSQERLQYYDMELSKAENRPADDGFLSGSCDNSKHLYGVNGAGVTHDYVAYVHRYDETRSLCMIEVKNLFKAGDEIEVFGPYVDNKRFVIDQMFDQNWNLVELANKPTQLLFLRIPFPVQKGDMFRKVNL